VLPEPVVPLDIPVLGEVPEVEPAVPVPLETLPEPVVPLLGLLADEPLVDEPTLGVAVEEELLVPGDALGALLPLTLACACLLQRSMSAWLGDDDCADAAPPIASKLPAQINAATCLVVVMCFPPRCWVRT
jgi:hypothetical protein